MHPEKSMPAYREEKGKNKQDLPNLHWTAIEWRLQEIRILKTKMACAPNWQFLPGPV